MHLTTSQIDFLKEMVNVFNTHHKSEVMFHGEYYIGPNAFKNIFCPAFSHVENIHVFTGFMGVHFAQNIGNDEDWWTLFYVMLGSMNVHKRGHKNNLLRFPCFKPVK